jgi:hypothetical protein
LSATQSSEQQQLSLADKPAAASAAWQAECVDAELAPRLQFLMLRACPKVAAAAAGYRSELSSSSSSCNASVDSVYLCFCLCRLVLAQNKRELLVNWWNDGKRVDHTLLT